MLSGLFKDREPPLVTCVLSAEIGTSRPSSLCLISTWPEQIILPICSASLGSPPHSTPGVELCEKWSFLTVTHSEVSQPLSVLKCLAQAGRTAEPVNAW